MMPGGLFVGPGKSQIILVEYLTLMIHGQEYLKELAEHQLDFSKAFIAQDPAVISDVCAQVPLPKFIQCHYQSWRLMYTWGIG